MAKTKQIIGALILVILTASIYILMPDNVRIDVKKTYSTFKVWENGTWIVAGQEYTLLYDGTTKMRASSRSVNYSVEGNKTTIVRNSRFKDNIIAMDTYVFDGSNEDVGLFPISHTINVQNGEGKILVYEVTKLLYMGETKKDLTSPQKFGHKMEIEWEDGNYYSRIWKYSNRDEGKLTIKYRPDSNNFTKKVRLFDPSPSIEFVPPTPPNATTTSNTSIEINVSIIEANLSEVKFNWNTTNYTIFNDSLVLMMNFDNVSALGENDTLVVDISGTGNNGTCSGVNCPVWNNTGKYGGAFEFDGVNDIIISSPINLSIFSIGTWAKPDGLQTLAASIISDKYPPYVNYALSFKGNTLDVEGGIYIAGWHKTPVFTLTDGEWVYLVLTYDGAVLRLYVNGVMEEYLNWVGIPESSGSELRIGRRWDAANYFNGSIDEVRIWNRSLSASEIQQLYFTNLNKYDTDKWLLYVNQSKNSTDGLDNGTYTYQAFAQDNSSNLNQTEKRTITIGVSPSIQIERIFPTTNINVTQNTFFNVTLNVTCITANCGTINVTLDPVWYNTSWNYRVKITTLATKVDADLTDYPVYVDLSNLPADFHTNVNQTDARDIRVTTSDGITEVPREVVFYDSAIDTGELHFKGNLTDASDTDFYIYYGNSGANDYGVADTYGRNNVWNDNYVGVWHLPNGTALTTADSLGVNDGVGSEVSASAGKMGGGVTPDNGGGEIDFGDDNSLNVNGTTNATFSFWTQRNGDSLSGTYTGFIVRLNAGVSAGYQIYALNTDDKLGYYEGTTFASDYVFTDANWHYIVITDNSTHIKFYVDGSLIGSPQLGTTTGTESSVSSQIIGYNNINGIDGQMDEVRIGAFASLSNWISTEYNNQNSSSTFYNVGSQETGSKSGIIPVGSGTPFYTNASQNPNTTISLNVGESQLMNFWVNATGATDVTHTFFAYANLTSDTSISNITTNWNVTIVSAVADTCSPSSPLTANYIYDCSDNCVQSSNLDAGGYNITITDDAGSFTLTANITNYSKLFIIKPSSCNVVFDGGKVIK